MIQIRKNDCRRILDFVIPSSFDICHSSLRYKRFLYFGRNEKEYNARPLRADD
jgi:hypothetical protein